VSQKYIAIMIRATAVLFLDDKRPKRNGLCSVKIKITHNRKRKYYSTGIEILASEYGKIVEGKRRTSSHKQQHSEMLAFQNKADLVISKLSIFTFDRFEEAYFEQRNVSNSVSFAFDKYIQELKSEGRIGTADSYTYAISSLETFKKQLTFAEISPAFLKKYHLWMLEKDKSITTVGIYLRSLRAIYNRQNIDSIIYPFGKGKDRYSIPTGKNTKKALTVEEIGEIFNYEVDSGSIKQMAKDYWIFLYLSSGMNVKDFCFLKWENINGNTLSYNRAKTKRSQKESKLISVALKEETLEIIKKWGQPSIVKDSYIFPHLRKEMSPEQERVTYKQLTKTINKYIKQITTEVGIDKNVTTYFARHSFATVLKRSGAKTEMISELLGHSSMSVTESYLDSFENEQIQEQTDVLTQGFKKVN